MRIQSLSICETTLDGWILSNHFPSFWQIALNLNGISIIYTIDSYCQYLNNWSWFCVHSIVGGVVQTDLGLINCCYNTELFGKYCTKGYS